MAQVTLTDLDKIYPPQKNQAAFHAVKGVGLEIRKGEFMVLVGPSGCGKSTTLRMIAGLEEISGGTIMIGNRVVNNVLPKDRGIAMVFQNYALYPHMTVFENMGFGLKIAKVAKSEIKRRVENAAAILGLDTMLDRKPSALSGGQRQRVAVGRAIVRNPQVFLFDEPLSNLDAKMRVSMRSEISKLHARLKTTMIYVTHDQIEAMTMGDRICVMRDGVIMQVADPLTLYHQPANAYVAGFIGSPPMNLIGGTLEPRGDTLHFVESDDPDQAHPGSRIDISLTGSVAAAAAKAPSHHVLLGIRPEDIGEVPATGTLAVDCRIELAEPMGSETYLHLRTASRTLVARTTAQRRFNTDTQITVHFDSGKLHLFDAGSEVVLRG